MDQSLKARLVGAAVLVILAVILVPELLSGRRDVVETTASGKAQDSRTFTIELGGAGNPRAEQLPSEPVPAATAATATPGAESADRGGAGGTLPESPAAAAAPPAASPAASPSSREETRTEAHGSLPTGTAPAPTSSEPVGAPGWLVQVGAFSNADAARKLVKDLEADGMAALISPVSRGGRTLHRVRVGPVADRAEAQRLAVRLEARGLPATVVESD